VLTTLLESDARAQSRVAGTVASMGIHTAVIVAAIVATASARSTPEQPEPDPERRTVYLPRAAAQSPRRESGSTRPTPSVPALERLLPPNAMPVTVPRSTVPIGALGEIDPRAMLRDDTLPAGPRGRIGGERHGLGTGDQLATISTVDKPASLLVPPRPRYPEQLRAAGVSGRVVVRFVVDTLGRVEPASIVVRESGHDLFEQSVRAVLPALRFVAAEVEGRKVRMLVELPFEFRLDR
jgi:periplasmic protein TonB